MYLLSPSILGSYSRLVTHQSLFSLDISRISLYIQIVLGLTQGGRTGGGRGGRGPPPLFLEGKISNSDVI